MSSTTALSSNQSAQGVIDQDDFVNRTIVTTLTILILVLGVIGNTAVIFYLGWKKRKKRSRYELLLLLLAIADLLSCISLCSVILARYTPSQKPTGTGAETRCWMSELFTSYAISASHTIILIICIERHRKITSPLEPGVKQRFIVIRMAIGLVVAILITVPFFFVACDICKELNAKGRGEVDLSVFSAAYITYLTLNLTRDILSFITMTILIHKMLISLSETSSSSLPDPDGIRRRKFASARKMLIAIIVCFLICVLPHSIYFLVIFSMVHSNYDFGSRKRTTELLGYTAYFKVFLAASCVVNPVIYSFMDPKFVKLRKDFQSFLTRHLRRRRYEDKTVVEHSAGKEMKDAKENNSVHSYGSCTNTSEMELKNVTDE